MHKSVMLLCASKAQESVRQARSIAEKWGFELVQEAPAQLYLIWQEDRLGLLDGADPSHKIPVTVDFLSAESLYRKQHGGGKSEPIVKAIGIKGKTDYHVLDATPGLGRDAFVLACAGCTVTMVERSSTVAALLEDGIKRLGEQSPEIAGQMSLVHGNSQDVMQYWEKARVDAVYLDPMFPHRKKSALVKKEMRLFQQLLGNDDDADLLLQPARQLATQRVVVKRPNSAPPLAQQSPSMAIKSKKHRFDVYVCK